MEKTNEWIKHMQQIKVVKRREQSEHLKQGDEQKQIYILQQINLHWYIKILLTLLTK